MGTRIRRAEVHAEDFSAYLDLHPGEVTCELYETIDVSPGQPNRGAPYEGELDLEPVGGPDFNETRHFVDCILEDRAPSLDESLLQVFVSQTVPRV